MNEKREGLPREENKIEQSSESGIKVFDKLIDLVDDLTSLARSGESLAVQTRVVEEGRDTRPGLQEGVVDYGLKDYGEYKYKREGADLQLVDVMFEKEEASQVKDFIKSYLDTEGKMNGSKEEGRVFETRIPGISLQVYKWEEWWQMMGGAHVGGKTILWLINHEPLPNLKKQ